MIQNLNKLFRDITQKGIPFPVARDTTTGGPSSTLFFTYTAFILAYIANIVLIIRDPLYGTITAIGFWGLSLVFYLMRRIKTFRFDVDDREFELDSGDESDKKKENTNEQVVD